MKDSFAPQTRATKIHTFVGYARVAAPNDDLTQQISALKKAGCHQIFDDVACGAKSSQPGLDRALDSLHPSDTLIVWKLDRLGRSLSHLVQIVKMLHEKGVWFRSLTENIDTTTPNGELVIRIFAVLAQFEHNLIRERTLVGQHIAASHGRKAGRKPVITPDKLARARHLIDEKKLSIRDAAARLNVGKSSLYAALKQKTPSDSEIK